MDFSKINNTGLKTMIEIEKGKQRQAACRARNLEYQAGLYRGEEVKHINTITEMEFELEKREEMERENIMKNLKGCLAGIMNYCNMHETCKTCALCENGDCLILHRSPDMYNSFLEKI